MLKLIGKLLLKIVVYFLISVVAALIAAMFTGYLGVIVVFLLFIIGSINAIIDEMKEEHAKYKEEKKRKKLFKDSGNSFGMHTDDDIETQGFESMLNPNMATFSSDVNYAQDSNAYVQSANRFCPQCGANVIPNSKFCNNCGCRL